ncbi:MAG: class I SAM-dependent methyltransferase [Candidatus Thermoplasmatota archaeon]|nr:class I SAM-dependent methyltransferase [Candidatus Thermoplasmatota archaeon]
MAEDFSKKSQTTWDTIAQSFDTTRKKPWKQCVEFINKCAKSDTIVDIGCGNGRHLLLCAANCKKAIGIDISNELLKIVKNKVLENKIDNVFLLQSDLVNLSIKDKSVDSVLFIASLHNVKERKNRVKALREVRRILKKDGRGLISVWSRWQDKYRKMFFKKWFTSFGKNEFGDIDIFWRQNGLNIPRYYHLYSKREFKNDIIEAGLSIIEFRSEKIISKKYPDNFFAIVQR